MTPTPAEIRIYHITHVDNLLSILSDGMLWSDAAMIARGAARATIGMNSIKERRLVLPVTCHPGDKVGEYVPFYFCPRSIMLYLLYRANHPELSYRGGQGPIVHLEADLHEAVAWANSNGRRWAFSLSNAGAGYAEFRSDLSRLGEIDWGAVAATDFQDRDIKEGKQAEFLAYDHFPWHLVRRIGVHSMSVRNRVLSALPRGSATPLVEVRSEWYF